MATADDNEAGDEAGNDPERIGDEPLDGDGTYPFGR